MQQPYASGAAATAAPTLSWGIIGCGNVTETKSGPALYKAAGSRLVAVMRRDEAKARDYAKRHGAAQGAPVRAYGTVAGLLGDADVNAVYVATPPSSHAEHVRAALAAGVKTVLVEKPMGMTLGECEALTAEAAAAGARLYVAYYRRHYPKWQAAKALLDGGAIGTLLGARLQMCNVAGAAGWRVDPAVSAGGHFVDVGSHRLDMVTYLLGGDIAEAAGFASNAVGHHAAENDVVGVLRLASGVLVSAAFHFHTKPQRDVLEIYGSAGTMVFDPFDGTDFTVRAAPAYEPVTHSHPTPSPVHLPFVQALVWHAGGLSAEAAAAAAAAAGMGPVDARLLATHVDGVEGTKATRAIDAFLAGHRKQQQ